MLVRCVIDDQIQNDTHIALVALSDENLHILHSSVRGVNGLIVRDVIAHVNLRAVLLGRLVVISFAKLPKHLIEGERSIGAHLSNMGETQTISTPRSLR